MNPRKWAWIVAGALFAVASIAIHYEVKIGMHQRSGPMHAMGNLKIREEAPDFTLRDLAGQTVTLRSFRGRKAVLLDFWAVWCGPCKAALPGLQDLADKFKDRDLEVVTIDQGETLEQVRYFIDRRHYSFRVLLDLDRAVGDTYGVRGIPTSVFVDKTGVVQWISVGRFSDDEMRKRIEQVIKE